MNILISDDHSIVRAGLKQLLKAIDPQFHIDEAPDGNDALAKIVKNNYDFIILDISMPGLSGLDILKALKERNIQTQTLVLSMHLEEQYALRAFNLGASGYLNKGSIYHNLEIAVKTILAGKRYISPEFAESLLFEKNTDNQKLPHERLSPREFQIMCMLAGGKSVKEVANNLCISDKTVSTHRMRLLDKMNFKKNAELTKYSIKNNLID